MGGCPEPLPWCPTLPQLREGTGTHTSVLSLPRIVEASKGGRLDKIEQGYESMDAFSVSLDHLTEAVHALDFDPGNSAPNAPLPTPTHLVTPTAFPGGSW